MLAVLGSGFFPFSWFTPSFSPLFTALVFGDQAPNILLETRSMPGSGEPFDQVCQSLQDVRPSSPATIPTFWRGDPANFAPEKGFPSRQYGQDLTLMFAGFPLKTMLPSGALSSFFWVQSTKKRCPFSPWPLGIREKEHDRQIEDSNAC